MEIKRHQAVEYLLPYTDGFWRWHDNGQVIAWQDGKTIAFRGEIIPVCKRLAARGLPPFDALLLVLAATRDNWADAGSEIGIVAALCQQMSDPPRSHDLHLLMEGLSRVRQLPRDLRASPTAKAVLAEVIFESSPVAVGADVAAAVVAALDAGLPDSSADAQVRLFGGPNALHRCFGPLVAALKHVDAERLRLRARTGLDSLVQPAQTMLPDAQQVRALLADLETDSELRGLAAVTRDLMAAVTLPRRVSERDELPVGGVSDFTHRGAVDRLLISELANDDLTLAVRVALGEALYYRRESPPRPRASKCCMLLDAGIRTWGVPRVLITAVALAFAATVRHSTQLVVFRGRGAHVDSVELRSRAGLTEHLAALSIDVHPGAAINAFEESLQSNVEADRIVITAEDAFEDDELRRALALRQGPPLYVATVSRHGRFRLHSLGTRGTKTLRETRIDIEKLFERAARPAPSLVEPAADLPAIFHVDPFPLRLSHSLRPDRSCYIPGQGVVSILADGRVMLWDRTGLGALQLTMDVPRGEVIWSRPPTSGDHATAVVKCKKTSQFVAIEVDARLREVRCIPLPVCRGRPRCFTVVGAQWAAVYDKIVDLFAPSTGQLLWSTVLPPGVEWNNARYFVRRSRRSTWYALQYDGAELNLVEVPVDGSPFICLLDGPDGTGPIGVTPMGDLQNITTGQVRKVKYPVKGPFRVRGSSGGKLFLQSLVQPKGEHKKIAVVDMQSLHVGSTHNMLSPDAWSCVNVRPVRRRISSISVDHDQRLVITTRRARWVLTCDVRAPMILRWVETRQQSGIHDLTRTFKDVLRPEEHGISLEVATWEDGSRAYVDSRGLLHLRSSDASVPQITLVLSDKVLAGWCADGRVFGPHYFTTGGDRVADSELQHILETSVSAFARNLR